eukprot:TRINITY_DN70_c0_g1_i1.p1 TRINITY_DN70_c0_g1~~TRINITY_DN70_c0_g1_i1.p1  ORF type:complete len:229 (+),score=42.46 TRINITY_DN70_c0_g1_i1:374-1060(+)
MEASVSSSSRVGLKGGVQSFAFSNRTALSSFSRKNVCLRETLERNDRLRETLERNDRRIACRRLRFNGGNGHKIHVTVRASHGQSDFPDHMPKASFYKVEAIVRPWSVSHVASGLLKIGIRGVTVSDVRGFGAQGGSAERQAGSEFSEDNFVSKVKMEIVVSKDQVESVINTVIEEARTGEIGDGKIFVIPVADVIRVRTGERGDQAERMIGGRAELLSGVHLTVHEH